MSASYDLLLKGGEVIDPAQGLRGVRDVALSDGKVADVAADISADLAEETVDVSGKIVTPGLIDIHGHYYQHVVHFATSADEVCLPNCVTTTVDAVSSGWMHFDGFKEYIVKREKTRLMALVNLSALGMFGMRREGGFGPTISIGGGPRTLLSPDTVGEMQDLRYAQVEETFRCIQDNPNVALGVKIRLDADNGGVGTVLPALERARRVADMMGSFMMVHVARVPIPLGKVFEYLRPGDIVSHIFHGAENNVLDGQGQVRSEAREAKSRGILLDIGAAKINFSIELSRAAIAQGMLPDTLSSDITKDSPGDACYNLLDVMSLYMSLGMSLEDVIRASTATSARAIGHEGVLGTLQPGAVGDVAVLEVQEGSYRYGDAEGVESAADRRIAPVITIKDGAIWRPDMASDE